jgi:hypothetical protein
MLRPLGLIAQSLVSSPADMRVRAAELDVYVNVM